MAERLYGRVASATVGTVRVENLDMRFRVTKSLKREPNTLELVIFNLNEKSRSAMEAKGARVQLLAGHSQAEVHQIFLGDVRHAKSRRVGSEWETKITSGDGERAYKFGHASASLPVGSSWKDALKAVVGGLDVNPGNLDEVADTLQSETFATGYTAHGRAANELDRLTKSKGLQWSVQDGQLQILKAKGGANRLPAILLSEKTGLLDTPEVVSPEAEGAPSGVKARSLLRGVYIPGTIVVLKADSASGNFRIEKVTHDGDTVSGNWFSDLELSPL